MKSVCLVLTVLMVSMGPAPAATIAEHGGARTVIAIDPAATAPEIYAAQQLASSLQEITGAVFEIRTNTESPAHAIIVGPGAAAASFQGMPSTPLGGEELIIRAEGDRI